MIGQSIKCQEYKNKKVYQCHNCQLTGHSSHNCNLSYRCVRCTALHKPGECPEKDKPDSIPKCVNCNSEGHPASYRGCDYLKFIKEKETLRKELIRESRINRINKIYQKTNPHLSYAQAFTNSNNFNSQFPHLRSQNPTAQANVYNDNNTLDAISEMILDMKNEIITAVNNEMSNVTKQVNSNTEKIEQIAQKLGLIWQ